MEEDTTMSWKVNIAMLAPRMWWGTMDGAVSDGSIGAASEEGDGGADFHAMCAGGTGLGPNSGALPPDVASSSRGVLSSGGGGVGPLWSAPGDGACRWGWWPATQCDQSD